VKAKKKFAERFVGITPRDFGELEDRQRKVLEIFSSYQFERILDVGCGDGNFTVMIAKACKAREIYGIEISEKGVEIARKNGIKCYQLDVDEEDFPFEDNFFDAVSALELIEHLFDPDHFLDEVYRVLKPEGIFVLSTPNLASIYNRIALLFGYQPFSMNPSSRHRVGHITELFGLHANSVGDGIIREFDHVRLFTYRTLKIVLNKHGFNLVKSFGARAFEKGVLRRGVETFANFIDAIISRFPSLSQQIIFVCSKM